MKNKFNLGDNLFYFNFNASDLKTPNLFIHQVTIDAMKVRAGIVKYHFLYDNPLLFNNDDEYVDEMTLFHTLQEAKEYAKDYLMKRKNKIIQEAKEEYNILISKI